LSRRSIVHGAIAAFFSLAATVAAVFAASTSPSLGLLWLVVTGVAVFVGTFFTALGALDVAASAAPFSPAGAFILVIAGVLFLGPVLLWHGQVLAIVVGFGLMTAVLSGYAYVRPKMRR